MDVYLIAALLGLVEGLTEFLPVSSTGHLVLLVDLLHFQAPPGKAFEIVIQLGAILAVCVVYWRRLLTAAVGMLHVPEQRAFVRNILIAFLPAMVVGAVAYPMIRRMLDSPLVVAVALVIGGIAILVIERLVREPRHTAIERFSAGLSLRIGVIQVLSMIPGVSRSGATIMGALMMGVERKAAAEFSFFLAIPTMAGATAYSIYKNYAVLSFDDAGLIALGFAVAFLSAMLVVRTAVAFIGRHGFAPFAWYRIVVGTAMLILLVA